MEICNAGGFCRGIFAGDCEIKEKCLHPVQNTLPEDSLGRMDGKSIFSLPAVAVSYGKKVSVSIF